MEQNYGMTHTFPTLKWKIRVIEEVMKVGEGIHHSQM
jgi:hypothetical protein